MEASDPNEQSLQLRNLGERGIQYVREQLTKAGPLSLLLANRNVASIVAMIPEGVDVETANDFHHGGIAADRYVWSDELNGLMRQRDSLVVADGWLNEPTDAHFQTKQHFLTESGGVYFFSSPFHYVDAEDLIRWASPYPSIVIASSFFRPISPGEALSGHETEAIAANAKVVFVGPYDEETYIRALLVNSRGGFTSA